MNELEEATAAGWLAVDMTDGPNPIGSRLLDLWPADSWVRLRFDAARFRDRSQLFARDVVLPGLVSGTVTGSIDLLSRKRVDR